MTLTLRNTLAVGSTTVALIAAMLASADAASGAAPSSQLGPTTQMSKSGGSAAYTVGLPVSAGGEYRLRVSLSESFYTSVGAPLFDVVAEGRNVSSAGVEILPTVVDFPASVQDGSLDAVLSRIPNRVKVKKIEAVAGNGGATAGTTPQPITEPTSEPTTQPAIQPTTEPVTTTFTPGTPVPPVGASFIAPVCTRTYQVPGLVSSTTNGDNTNAFNAALASAAEGDCLTVPAGFYRRSGNIDVPGTKRNITLIGAGRDQTIIYGTSLDKHGFRVLGADGIRLQSMTVDTVTGGTRTGLNQQGNATLLLDPGTDGFAGQDLLLRGARAAGFFAYRASNYHLNRVEVQNSLADGFHNTNGSVNGVFTDCVATNVGDDGWAMVAYGDGPETVPHDFVLTRFTMNGNTWGRGIGVINSYGLTVNGPTLIKNTGAAGVILAREAQYGPAMYPVRNVRFLGETRIVAANHGVQDHGAVLINNPEASQPVEGIYMEDVRAFDTGKNRTTLPSNNVYVKGNGRISAELRGFTFYGTGPRSLFGGQRTADSVVSLVGWSPADGYRAL